MKLGMKLIVAAMSLALVGPVVSAQAKVKAEGAKAAKADGGKKAAHGLRGKVVKVDGTSLIIHTAGKNGADQTIATDASTKVAIDGKDATLADLKEGQMVSVSPETGTAQTITVAAAKPKKAK